VNRYRDYNSYLKGIFGERVQKIPLDAGLNCPNRDGTISEKGCIFCDSRGSGTGALVNRGLSIRDQVLEGARFAERRYGAKKFIAYFQSFTNTNAPVPTLESLYDQALNHPGMVGLSVGTRPDCVNREVFELLRSYQKDYLVWIEYGLQSAHDSTLSGINRGHDVACFERGARMAGRYGLNLCAHVILGLPGETGDMMMETARFLGTQPVQGVKIHMLYIVNGTPLAQLYRSGKYRCLEQEEYVALVVDFLEQLPPHVVVQRLTGDPVRKELVAPKWAEEKIKNLNLIRQRMKRLETWQGRKCGTSAVGSSMQVT